MSVYSQPGTDGSVITFKPRYEHFIGGQWVPPVKGQYFEDVTPVTGRAFTEVARGTDWAQACRRANAAGAIKVTRKGPTTAPTAAEIDAYLDARR